MKTYKQQMIKELEQLQAQILNIDFAIAQAENYIREAKRQRAIAASLTKQYKKWM